MEVLEKSVVGINNYIEDIKAKLKDLETRLSNTDKRINILHHYLVRSDILRLDLEFLASLRRLCANREQYAQEIRRYQPIVALFDNNPKFVKGIEKHCNKIKREQDQLADSEE